MDNLFAMIDGFEKFEPYSQSQKQVSVYAEKKTANGGRTTEAV